MEKNIIHVDRIWHIKDMKNLSSLIDNFHKNFFKEEVLFEKVLVINGIYNGILNLHDIEYSSGNLGYAKHILMNYKFAPNTIIYHKLRTNVYWEVKESESYGVVDYEINPIIENIGEKLNLMLESIKNLHFLPNFDGYNEAKEHFESLAKSQ